MKKYILKEKFTFSPKFEGEDNGSMNNPPITITKGEEVEGVLNGGVLVGTYWNLPVNIPLGKLNEFVITEKPILSKFDINNWIPKTPISIAISILVITSVSAIGYFGVRALKK